MVLVRWSRLALCLFLLGTGCSDGGVPSGTGGDAGGKGGLGGSAGSGAADLSERVTPRILLSNGPPRAPPEKGHFRAK